MRFVIKHLKNQDPKKCFPMSITLDKNDASFSFFISIENLSKKDGAFLKNFMQEVAPPSSEPLSHLASIGLFVITFYE